MGTLLTYEDIQARPSASGMTRDLADRYIRYLEAIVATEAPCLLEPDLEQPKRDRAQGILEAALLRWFRAEMMGDNVSTRTESAGPYSISTGFDTSRSGEGRLYDREIAELKALCADATATGVRRRRPMSVPFR